MILCDWCGDAKDCLPKEIDDREFDRTVKKLGAD
jgi:hypothetical protein